MRRLLEQRSSGAYSHTEDARHIRFKFIHVVKEFMGEYDDYSLVDLRLILSDALADATIQESIKRRLTEDR